LVQHAKSVPFNLHQSIGCYFAAKAALFERGDEAERAVEGD